jgi:hypothetical protein
MTVDAWEEPIGVYLAQIPSDSGPLMRERPYVTLAGVLKALQIPVERQGQAEQRRVVSIIKRMGWLRRAVRSENGSKEYRYMKPSRDTFTPIETAVARLGSVSGSPRQTRAAARKAPAKPEQPDLFVAQRWAASLFGSPRYQEQRRQTKRAPLSDDQVRALLAALTEAGGQMTKMAMARRMNLAPFRLTGQLLTLRKLLNVDGYPVLSIEDVSDTVSLNRALLETQFELG